MKLKEILFKKGIFLITLFTLLPRIDISFAENFEGSSIIDELSADFPKNTDEDQTADLQKDIYILGPGDELL